MPQPADATSSTIIWQLQQRRVRRQVGAVPALRLDLPALRDAPSMLRLPVQEARVAAPRDTIEGSLSMWQTGLPFDATLELTSGRGTVRHIQLVLRFVIGHLLSGTTMFNEQI